MSDEQVLDEQRVSGVRYRLEPRAEAEFTDRRAARRLALVGADRMQVDLDLSDWSDHNFYAGFDGTIDGVFIATHRGVRLGDKVEVTINLPESLTPVVGVGEVRWLREYNDDSDAPPGMGVCIDELEDHEVEAVEDFVSRREPLFFTEEEG